MTIRYVYYQVPTLPDLFNIVRNNHPLQTLFAHNQYMYLNEPYKNTVKPFSNVLVTGSMFKNTTRTRHYVRNKRFPLVN